MKAFIAAIAAIIVITVGANYVLNDTVGVSTAERTAASDVRLPGDAVAPPE